MYTSLKAEVKGELMKEMEKKKGKINFVSYDEQLDDIKSQIDTLRKGQTTNITNIKKQRDRLTTKFTKISSKMDTNILSTEIKLVTQQMKDLETTNGTFKELETKTDWKVESMKNELKTDINGLKLEV